MASSFQPESPIQGISLVNLITFNQIKSFSTRILYADSKTHSSSKRELVWLSDFDKNKMATKTTSRISNWFN